MSGLVSEFPATDQQKDFIRYVVRGDKNAALIARAGCGKTNTILRAVNAIRHCMPADDIMICAYNKAIEKEISEKLKKEGHVDWKKVQAQTLHALGYGLVRYAFDLTKESINENKVRDIVHLTGDEVLIKYDTTIANLVSYAKNSGIGFFQDLPIGDEEVWLDMADHYDIDLGEDMQEATIIIQGAMRALQLSNDDVKQIDFDDMIYMPLIKRLRTKFGRMHVFLDEAQDLSRTRQVLARKFVASRGRMYIVGDDRQAIYGFSGADADALHNLIKELDCETFPLNITWRCPVSVVNLAKSIVPDFTSAPEAPEGAVSVVQLKGKDPLPSFLPTDVIMCRNNKPLVSLALTLLKNRVPCKMEGRGIGQSLVALCKRWKIKNIAPFITKLEDYREREIGKAKAKRRENKIEEINDKVDALKTIALQVQSEGNTLLIAVIDFINSLFADDVANVLTLCSYHRSKGREWQNVYLLNHYSYSPSKGARLPWQVVQEQNLAYVAFTRAQSTLTFLNLPE